MGLCPDADIDPKILTSRGYKSLRPGVKNPFVQGLKILTFKGYKSLRPGVINPYVEGLYILTSRG